MSAPDLASAIYDTVRETQNDARTFLRDGTVRDQIIDAIRATLAASAELRSVEEALADVQKRAVVGVGQKDFWPKIDAALSALRAITGRKA